MCLSPFLLSLCFFCLITCCNVQQQQQQLKAALAATATEGSARARAKQPKTVNRSSCFASIEKFADSARQRAEDSGLRAATQQRRFLLLRYSCFTLLLLLLFLCSVAVAVALVVIVYLHLDIRRLFVVVVLLADVFTGLRVCVCERARSTLQAAAEAEAGRRNEGRQLRVREWN